MIERFTGLLRSYLVQNGEFALKRISDIDISDALSIEDFGIYIHIPFCKNYCPYCPYNKIMYEKILVEPFLKSIKKEIEIYGKYLKGKNIKSIYIGGGTPTNIIEHIGEILEEVKKWFNIDGSICIETNPSDINEENVKKLKEYGIDIISCGVQSFQDKFLKFIGRNYDSKILPEKIKLLIHSGFKSINIDLMFALPEQNTNDIINDLDKAIELGIKQITTYPLFTFPYSKVGKFLKLKNVKMPNIFKRRIMYRTIHSYLLKNGFKRVSVWGFIKGNEPRYSSVTRDFYIGFGPGAGSSLKNAYYLNTFSFNHYVDILKEGKFPVSLKMELTDDMRRYYWFYWRLYDTIIKEDDFNRLFKDDNRVKKIIEISHILGFYKMEDGNIVLNERGSFYLHLLQNYFLLNYINKVWSKAMEEPFPEKIIL
uniref:Coproporphyrinogen III oxidase family protein n=1 Tax=candidate division WOR-3 bacterium TaxID=2052148 RepID=A0A7C4UFT1_UNCW3